MNAKRDKRWAKVRRAVIGRDVLCRMCGSRPSAEADHIIPLALGGSDDPANLQGLCRDCHRKKTKTDWLPSKIVSLDGSEVREVARRKRAWQGRQGRQPMRIK